jgi:hypothetical protein
MKSFTNLYEDPQPVPIDPETGEPYPVDPVTGQPIIPVQRPKKP